MCLSGLTSHLLSLDELACGDLRRLRRSTEAPTSHLAQGAGLGYGAAQEFRANPLTLSDTMLSHKCPVRFTCCVATEWLGQGNLRSKGDETSQAFRPRVPTFVSS